MHKSKVDQDELKKIVKDFAKEISGGGVVALIGEMGAGKTTLVKMLGEELGVKNNISSPTFVIAHRYIPSMEDKQIWHIDLYRLNELEEIKELGIEEMVNDKNNIVLIEWPEKILHLLPRQRWEIRLSADGDETREVIIDKLEE